MHTRQDVVMPAQPNHTAAQKKAIERLRRSLAPKWAPLDKLCPPGLCEHFMYMGKVDGIYLYKHVDSRRYLNVDAAGRTYAFNSETSKYRRISEAAAMRSLALEDCPADLFTPAERTALMVLITSVRVRP